MAINYASLKGGYQKLWDTCQVRPESAREVESIANAIAANKNRYSSVSAATGVPWWLIGLMHNMECGMDFTKHLHCGDPLTARTYNVPAGQPKSGKPPFTWEYSATDALLMPGQFKGWTDYSIPAVLYKLEGFNGFGYRNKGINSPYLWSKTTNYSKGKYVSDGKYSATAISQQVGCAAVMKVLANKGLLGGASNTPVVGGDYSLGCVDAGVASGQTLVGVHNPTSQGDALSYALGLHTADRGRAIELRVTIDIASNPNVLELDAQKKFQVKGFAADLDGEYSVEEMFLFFGDTPEAEIIASAPDPNAPKAQVFLHNTIPQTNTATPQGNPPPAGTINERIFKGAIASQGESSRRGPGFGNVACAWCINTLVLPKAGIAQIGSSPDSVDSVEAALTGGRGQLVTPRSATQQGDIVIMGKGSHAHIGVCVAAGGEKILSNSSSKAAFSWVANLQTYDRYYDPSHPCRIYRVLN